uniref:Adaptor related protein complex 1 subunit sigma 1 n=1 Tax=Pavo cristatus TaxID=9049 RepID=A0A8C9G1W8_PAVCR
MLRFVLLFSRQGKLRLQQWYRAGAERDKRKAARELMQAVLARKPKMCSFLEWGELKVVYKRWAPSRPSDPADCAARGPAAFGPAILHR